MSAPEGAVAEGACRSCAQRRKEEHRNRAPIECSGRSDPSKLGITRVARRVDVRRLRGGAAPRLLIRRETSERGSKIIPRATRLSACSMKGPAEAGLFQPQGTTRFSGSWDHPRACSEMFRSKGPPDFHPDGTAIGTGSDRATEARDCLWMTSMRVEDIRGPWPIGSSSWWRFERSFGASKRNTACVKLPARWASIAKQLVAMSRRRRRSASGAMSS